MVHEFWFVQLYISVLHLLVTADSHVVVTEVKRQVGGIVWLLGTNYEHCITNHNCFSKLIK
jgi:hypothetical protein